MEAIENSIIIPIKDLLGKSSLGVDITLAIIGFAAIALIFLISLLFILFSNSYAFRKKLLAAKDYLKNEEEISEDNVEGFNENIKKMPESIERGWGCFLEQKLGYPSDYITKRDVFADKKYETKNTAGKVFYRIFSVIVIAIVIWLEVLISGNDSLMSVGIQDFTTNFNLVGAILAAFFLPLIVYIIFSVILNAIYNTEYKKLEKSFLLFQNILDDKVVIYAEENDEFLSDNIDEINVAIEEIIANKLDAKEIIEIVTAPTVEEKQTVEFADVVVEPKEEVVEKSIKAPNLQKKKPEIKPVVEPKNEKLKKVEKTVEVVERVEKVIQPKIEVQPEAQPEVEEERIPVEVLVNAINNAISMNAPKADLEELAVLADKELQKGVENQAEQNALVDCLQKLAEKYQAL